MSKKILKITMIFLIIILSIFGIQSKVQAKDLTGMGNIIRAGWWARYSAYRDKNADVWFGKAEDDTFCIEKGGPLWLDRESYPRILQMKVSNRIEINGLDSNIFEENTDKSLATYTTDENAIFAWILSRENQSFAGDGQYSTKQLAIYGYIQDWLNANKLEGLPKDKSELSHSDWVREGKEYAESLKRQDPGPAIVAQHTEPTVETAMYENTEYIKIGPYAVSYAGNFDYAKVYDQNDREIPALFAKYEGETLKVSQNPNDIISSETQFFVLVPEDQGIERINKVDLGVYKDTNNIKATVWILKHGTYQDLISTTATSNPERVPASITTPPQDLLGNLRLEKVNKANHDIKLDNVTFIFKNKNEKYIRQDGDQISYVDRDQATEFTTDENGEILIENVIIGTYTAYEVKNEHYGYEVKTDGIPVKVTVHDEDKQLVENKQKWIKLSGYVWKDMIFGKDSQRNDLFQDNSYDKNDELMPGVPVRLKSKSTGKVLQEKTTDENGAYLFEDVLIEELEDYYIEFEYDGLIYTNVIPHIDVDNGSKAAEGSQERETFNSKFSTVEGKDASNNIGQTTGPNGEVVYNNLQYRKGEIGNEDEQYKSFFEYDKQYFPITANTNETGYSINSKFKPGVEEIKHNNLGLYLRDKPDVALKKDVQNAIVSINGYNHTYNYASRYENQGEYESGFNVGVKFKANKGYTRPIYKADALYRDNQDNSKELKVKVTYRIRYRNESTTLGARVNKLVDYYDADYGELENVKVGTSIDENGNITGDELTCRKIASPNSKYNAIEIDAPETILQPGKSSAPKKEEDNTNPEELTPEQQQVYNDALKGENQGVKDENNELKGEYQGSDIYVQFTMSRDKVKAILDKNEDGGEDLAPLDNVVEITSYTSFDSEGKLYAGVDMDSAPGNATPDDLNTYEDDTDSAPSFVLIYHPNTEGRKMSGTVFEDEYEKDNNGQKTTKGDGRLGDAERRIEGVTAQLYEIKEDGSLVPAKQYDEAGNESEIPEVSTKTDGSYTFKGFVPGNYIVKFTWGKNSKSNDGGEERIYYPESYKSTTIPLEEYSRKYSDAPDWDWYKENKDDMSKDLRYSDAVDDYNRREEIDNKIKHQIYANSGQNSFGTIDMESKTARMNATVEFADLEVTKAYDENGNNIEDVVLTPYAVQNIDFGIIERPIQDLKLTKEISAIRLTLPNGQVLVDATINKDPTTGKVEISGQKDSFTYMEPNPNSTVAPYGLAKLELDDEVMQGATLQVEYKYKVENISDPDYNDPGYYVTGDEAAEFIWPIAKWNNAQTRAGSINSLVGNRIAPTAGASSDHKGTDIQASGGQDEVLAISGGVVEFAGNNSGWGNMVVINHGKVTDLSDNTEHTLYTLSAHMNSINVRAGDIVAQGQKIGIAGSTGVSTGPHLHLEATLDANSISGSNPTYLGIQELCDGNYLNGTTSSIDGSRPVTGTHRIIKEPVTLSAEEVEDYLDADWGYDANNDINRDNGWQQVESSELGVDDSGNTNIPKFTDPDTNTEIGNMFADKVATSTELKAKRVLKTTKLEKDLKPKESIEASLVVSKVLAEGEGDIELNNEAEITHIYKKHGGKNTTSIPGNYVPGTAFEIASGAAKPDNDTGISATTTVTPPTGSDAITYIIYTASVIVALIILGGGIVLIKKKVLTK